MKLTQRWDYAGRIISEIRFQGFLEMNPSNLARVKEDPDRIARSIRRSKLVSSFISAFIVFMLAAISISSIVLEPSSGFQGIRLAIGMTVYLSLCYAMLIFMNLTYTTGFLVSNAMDLPSILPFSKDDLESIAYLTFVRMFFAPAVLIITVFPVLCLFYIGPLVSLIACIASAATVSLSVGSLVYISKWYYRKAHSFDDSRTTPIVRMLASLSFAIGMILVFSLGSLAPSLIQIVIDISVSITPGFITPLAIVFPFSFGFLASNAAYPSSLTVEAVILSLLASTLYIVGSVVVYRRTSSTLRNISFGMDTLDTTHTIKQASVSISSPLVASVKKDLMLASRSIGSAFLFVIPLFLIMFMYPMIYGWAQDEPLRSMTALIAIEYGNLFGGIAIVSVMRFDTQGASIHSGLPLSTNTVLKSKALIAFIPYIISMIAVTIIMLMFPVISPWILVIPLIQIPCGYILAFTSGGVLYKQKSGGRAAAVDMIANPGLTFFAAMIGAVVGILPLLGYGIIMILTGNHLFCLAVQFVLVVLEIAVLQKYIPTLLKD